MIQNKNNNNNKIIGKVGIVIIFLSAFVMGGGLLYIQYMKMKLPPYYFVEIPGDKCFKIKRGCVAKILNKSLFLFCEDGKEYPVPQTENASEIPCKSVKHQLELVKLTGLLR